jgi:hypothetical protein
MSSYGTTTANGPSSASEESSGSTAQQAKDKAQETASQAKDQAKGRVRDQVDQRSTEAGERVGTVAQDVRSVSEELRKQGKDQPAKLAEQAAQRAESLGDYLKRSDGDTILRDVEDFGRRQPWAVVAGGIALGFAASRFLKASSTRRAQTPRQPALPEWRGDAAPATGLSTAGAPTTRTGLGAGGVGGDYGTTAVPQPGLTDDVPGRAGAGLWQDDDAPRGR